MNFKELNEKLGGNENKADWKQASGGGWINKSAKVEREDLINENAIVLGNVSGNAWVKPVLFVIDSRGHGASNCKHGWLKIGCEEHSFAEWVERFEAIARSHNLNEVEKTEYRAIVELFRVAGK